MPVNGLTVGDDVALVFTTPNGALNVNLTEFEADPVYTDIKSRPIGKSPTHGLIPDGWKGSFKADRNNPNIDNYFATQEAGYYGGQSQGYLTIAQTVTEPDGSLTQWRYTQVTIKLAKGGSYSGDKKVEQTVEFMASRKIKVS